MSWLNRLEEKISENPPGSGVAKVAKPPLAPLATAVPRPFQKKISPRKALRVFEYRLTDNPNAWLVLIAPGCDLDEARDSLRVRFGERLIDVKEYKRAKL